MIKGVIISKPSPGPNGWGRSLKALRWRTPFQAILDAWAKDPSIFKINPHHLIPGPNS